jgi:peptide/nickel transport system permease protein
VDRGEEVKTRLLLVPITLVGITLVTFVLLHLAPGNPAEVRAGQGRGVTPESIAAFRHAYGLDRPLATRYLGWLGRSLTLDFGRSLTDGRPVREKMLEAFPRTLALALLATLFAYGVAVPLGVALAARDQRPLARIGAAGLYGLYALPTAALALLALEAGAPYGGSAASLLVAAACLATATLVRLARHQRSALLAALRADWVRTAHAAGAGEARVLLRHALPNALLPMVTLLAGELPALLSGSVIVEQVFGIRGLGLLGFDAVVSRDYPVLLGLTMLGAAITLAGVLAADLAYRWLDPRLREHA